MSPLLSIALYITYRLFRAIFTIIHEFLCGFLLKRSREDVLVCQTLRILARNKFVLGDIARDNDFWFIHDCIRPAKILASHYWTIYTVSKQFVYFTRLPKPLKSYHSLQAPFLYHRQFLDAKKLARLSIDQFIKFSELCGPPKGPVTILNMSPRSGSTLLIQMLQVDDSITTLSEVDAFSNPAIFLENGFWSFKKVAKISRAILYVYCKDMSSTDVYIMKQNSAATRLAPILKQVCPTLPQLFQIRGLKAGLASCDKILRENNYSIEMVSLWCLSQTFARWLTPVADCYAKTLQIVGIRNALEFALIYYLKPLKVYRENVESFDLPAIWYEDLVEDPESVLLLILEICGISKEKLANAVNRLKFDSQAGTQYSQARLKGVKGMEIKTEQIPRLVEIAQQIGLGSEVREMLK